jgi:hypothetical protein
MHWNVSIGPDKWPILGRFLTLFSLKRPARREKIPPIWRTSVNDVIAWHHCKSSIAWTSNTFWKYGCTFSVWFVLYTAIWMWHLLQAVLNIFTTLLMRPKKKTYIKYIFQIFFSFWFFGAEFWYLEMSLLQLAPSLCIFPTYPRDIHEAISQQKHQQAQAPRVTSCDAYHFQFRPETKGTC